MGFGDPDEFRIWVDDAIETPTGGPDLVIPFTSYGTIRIPATPITNNKQARQAIILPYKNNKVGFGAGVNDIVSEIDGLETFSVDALNITGIGSDNMLTVSNNPLSGIMYQDTISMFFGIFWFLQLSSDGINWGAPQQASDRMQINTILAYPNATGSTYVRVVLSQQSTSKNFSPYSNVLKIR
jgi:hypothetical protein